MRRRRDSISEFNIWPAFTDALSGLVMVLIFLITVFVITEVLIGREIMGKDSAIGQLQRIVEHLEGLAGDAEKEAARLRGRMQGLESSVGERDKLLAQLRDELAAVQAARAALSADKNKAEQTATSAQEQAALLSARAERLATELERLNRALAANQKDLAQRDAVIVEQKGRIEALDSALKKKLLERVEELEKYASDFFGRLREVFANNPDIKVVGDRFVFQSEVLFASGEATLSVSGAATWTNSPWFTSSSPRGCRRICRSSSKCRATPTGRRSAAAVSRPTGSCPPRERSKW
jgi:chemotaxis protein MotB